MRIEQTECQRGQCRGAQAAAGVPGVPGLEGARLDGAVEGAQAVEEQENRPGPGDEVGGARDAGDQAREAAGAERDQHHVDPQADPGNGEDMFALLNTAYQYPGPALVRYPRDSTEKPKHINTSETAEIGKAIIIREGAETAILVFGTLLDIASEVGETLNTSVVNMRFIKPLDEELIEQMASTHQYLVTIEDSAIAGGAGSAVLELLNLKKISTPCLRLGLDDRFPSHGSREQVLKEYGLDLDGIRDSISEFTGT